MSGQSRTSSRSPLKNAFTTKFSVEQITEMPFGDLKKNCKVYEIDMRGVDQRKRDSIIDRILGRTSYSEKASPRSSSARASSSPRASSPRASSPRASSADIMGESTRSSPGGDAVVYIKVSAARKSPKRRSASASAAADRDDPDTRALKRAREFEVAAWDDWKKKNGGQPWLNLVMLKHIFDRKMMPEHMTQLSDMLRTLVILVGPAAAGKSSALKIVGPDLTDDNTVRVDPDRMYEWLAHKYGYFPPEIKEITDPKPYDSGENDEKYKERCADHRAKLIQQNADRLAWWIANQGTFDEHYGREFQDDRPRGFEASKFCTPKTSGVLGQYKVVLPSMANMIFEGATRNKLNVLLDTTGGMEEGFLEGMAERFTTAGYKVVVVLVVSSVEDCIARVSGPGGRNAKQHRKLDEEIVGRIWRDFIKHETACRWERFSREQGNEFVVVQNTGTQTIGSVPRVVYRRKPGSKTHDLVPEDELAIILNTYKVSNHGGRFVCHGAAGSAAGSASSRRGSHGHGGSSRKRRISRRRIHCSRARKTIKKYSRPVTRRHRRHHRHI